MADLKSKDVIAWLRANGYDRVAQQVEASELLRVEPEPEAKPEPPAKVKK